MLLEACTLQQLCSGSKVWPRCMSNYRWLHVPWLSLDSGRHLVLYVCNAVPSGNAIHVSAWGWPLQCMHCLVTCFVHEIERKMHAMSYSYQTDVCSGSIPQHGYH